MTSHDHRVIKNAQEDVATMLEETFPVPTCDCGTPLELAQNEETKEYAAVCRYCHMGMRRVDAQ